MNNSFEEIATTLERANSILLFPHSNMDGDALGSCVALCRSLISLGKDAKVYIDEDVPANLMFLEGGTTVSELSEDTSNNVGNLESLESLKNKDIAILIDSSEIGRLKERADVFRSAKKSICIDHHATGVGECDLNYIAPEVAATAELVYELICELEKVSGRKLFDSKIAEAIYTGIVTDTGRFQYSNTTKITHLIAAELFDYGIDQNKVAIEIFQSDRFEKIKLRTMILNDAHTFAQGRAVVATMAKSMLKDSGAKPEESEGVVEELRNIKGVEVAILIKETDDQTFKVSMRSKEAIDVAKVAQSYGGGGHIRAAGFTFDKELEILKADLTRAISGEIDRWTE